MKGHIVKKKPISFIVPGIKMDNYYNRLLKNIFVQDPSTYDRLEFLLLSLPIVSTEQQQLQQGRDHKMFSCCNARSSVVLTCDTSAVKLMGLRRELFIHIFCGLQYGVIITSCTILDGFAGHG